MKKKFTEIDRRNFLKTMGAAGLGSVFASAQTIAEENKKNATEPEAEKTELPQVPRRKLGKTGVEVPVLSLGTIFNVLEKQILLRKSLEWGVTYWDTAYGYTNGNSELGIGKFLEKNPEVRKKLFIVSKASDAETPDEIEKRLQSSLKRMNTEYVDLYYGVHGLDEPEQLTDELKQWAESAKKRKLIRFFGFSTHDNMAECLMAASKLDWIDAIMPSYNFRLMQDDKMQEAVEACHKAGIGLIAMKTQARRLRTEKDKKLAEHFLQQGFTEGQAKVKIVLEDKRISCACVGRDNLEHLMLNIAAVLDKTKLTQADTKVFKEYAQETCSSYCAGCGHICNATLPDAPYISKIMRYLMYYNSYGEQNEARQLFAKIPRKARNKLLSMDYSLAEAQCPQHLPISELVAEAASKLA
ncbi:MAG: aldo/keto reductase [Planctomycetota bacterium]|jgi:predicted aldo/keto reductase-like oxidoreductase